MMLYAVVNRFGGYKKVSGLNQWAAVATSLQFQHMQYPTAPQELKEHYERNLGPFEDFLAQQQRQRAMNIQMQGGGVGGYPGQKSPTKQMSPGAHSQQIGRAHV